MTKHRWEGSIRSLRNHIDPEKEEQLKWVQMEIKNNVKKILKLAKNINPGNKDGNLKKKAEIINLVEDFHQQYDSLYSLYQNLRGEVKKNIKGIDGDDNLSSSTLDSESYYSPEELNVKSGDNNSDVSKASDNEYIEPETSDKEYTILKDKLTSTSEVKRSIDFDNLPESLKFLKNLTIQEEESQRLAQIKDLELQVESLKCETGELCTEKRKLEEQLDCKSNEAKEMEEKISRLESQVLETESKFKENEIQFSFTRKQFEGKEQGYTFRISDLVAKADNLQVEVNNLKLQKSKLEEQLSVETEQKSHVKGLMERVDILENELGALNSQKEELELELKKKLVENSECLIQIETLRNELMSKVTNEQRRMEEKAGLQVRVKDLELEIHSLSSNKSDLQEKVKKINQEISQSNAEKEELNRKISELQTAISEKEQEQSKDGEKFRVQNKSLTDQVKALEKKVETFQNERNNSQVELETLQNEKKQLQMELEKESSSKSMLEKKNTELSNKIADQQKTLLELGDAMDKLKSENIQAQGKFIDSKSNLQLVERKIEEIAEEYRQQFEAKYTILGRRIRVAEQLHVENKEWYLKTKDTYEEENKDLKDKLQKFNSGIKSVKAMSLTANDILTSLDSVSLKFEECAANFLNRISKSSCELKFVKDWAMRKKKALLHMKDELECLLKQLGDKEAEILTCREKVWKSENKVRELEKMVKEKDEGMLGLKEEKREAIRQLCVWIDYHRSRSDFYKKTLSEMNPVRKRAS